MVWAFVDVLRNTDYGAGVPDDRIALAELYSLDQFYESRGLFFDGIFDNRITVFEALSLIGRAGRATPVLVGGQITLVRDLQRTLPVSLFSMRNIRKGSFSVNYLVQTEDSSNAAEVEYLDESNFKPKKIFVIQPGTTGNRPLSLKLFGVTNFAQADSEARYLVATNQYRRRQVSFTTEMDGFICRYGDLILVSHEMTQWGVSGEVIDFDLASKRLTLSEPVTVVPGSVIELALQDGSVVGPFEVNPGVDEFNVVVPSLTVEPYTGGVAERTRFVFGNSATFRQMAKITALQPRGIDSVEVRAVIEDNRVYSFANDAAVVAIEQGPAKFAPDEAALTYESASASQRSQYAFYARTNGRMSNEDSGYSYGSP
ncbi:MAG TPA: hypothetical protein DCF63_09820 [Planctomycetaceae bacterium]|nr:hypothetical protein [Planctomycetaceae bacterium]